MSAKKLLQPLVHNLVSQLSASGHALKNHDCYQLLHAAIGSVSPEIASRTKLPFLAVRVHDRESRQYNLYDTMLRAKKLLNISDLQAVAVAEQVIELLRGAGIGINQVQLLLDCSIPRQVKRSAFKALLKNLELNDAGLKMDPATATLAIAAGLITKPDTTWQKRFEQAAAFPKKRSELVDLVTESECYFWVLPPASSDSTRQASHDRYIGQGQHASAELGMGFSIIEAGWTRPKSPLNRSRGGETFTQYRLTSPMWSCRVNSGTWGLGNLLVSSIQDGAPYSSDRLHDLLPGGLKSLPRIHGCHTCRTLFIEPTAGYEDVPTRCNCAISTLVSEKSSTTPASE